MAKPLKPAHFNEPQCGGAVCFAGCCSLAGWVLCCMDRRPARHPTQYTWRRRRRRRSVGGNWLRVSFWNLWSTWFVSCVMMKLGGARDRENVRQAASGGPDERFFFFLLPTLLYVIVVPTFAI